MTHPWPLSANFEVWNASAYVQGKIRDELDQHLVLAGGTRARIQIELLRLLLNILN